MKNFILYEDDEKKIEIDGYFHWLMKQLAVKDFRLKPQEMNYLLALAFSILKDKNPDDITTYDITDGVKNDDAFCKRVFEQWQCYLFVGLVSQTKVYNPDCIVISGGKCNFIDIKKLEENINKESVVTDVKVKVAMTENNAGMIGAGVLALQ